MEQNVVDEAGEFDSINMDFWTVSYTGKRICRLTESICKIDKYGLKGMAICHNGDLGLDECGKHFHL